MGLLDPCQGTASTDVADHSQWYLATHAKTCTVLNSKQRLEVSMYRWQREVRVRRPFQLLLGKICNACQQTSELGSMFCIEVPECVVGV